MIFGLLSQHKKTMFLVCVICCLVTSLALGESDIVIHQDSVNLSNMTSGVMPADGLISLELGTRGYGLVYSTSIGPHDVSMRDYYLRVEAGPTSWLQTMVEVPWRSWSLGKDWIPASGSGLGDGVWQLTSGRSFFDDFLNTSLTAGGNLLIGSGPELNEDAFSPHAVGALSLRLWKNSQVPEMRLHFNYGMRLNKAEDQGYGTNTETFQPWFPRYQTALQAGGNAANDYRYWAVGLEFRKLSTAMWFEFRKTFFMDNDSVSDKEMPVQAAAGLRWGLAEGWAVKSTVIVGLAQDDINTDYYPSYSDLSFNLGISRQFSFGGRDRDRDGIVDRKDRCPQLPEDIDGFMDDDGCPDIDNDGDGIQDRQDGSPDEPEDFDGFEDEDGIPDLDNDGDGIPDSLDSCPDEAEDFDGQHDDDGCPDGFNDRDGDGIDDAVDSCPDQAEDFDGFEDEDGCPEADNDLDGINDEQDQCPDEPEDYNGVADQDGCPDNPAPEKSTVDKPEDQDS